jgi:hypothetical protein
MSCASGDTLPSFHRGDTYRPVRVVYPDVDITGWIFSISLKANLNQTTPDAQTVVVAAGEAAEAGEVVLALTSAQTAIPPGIYHMDIERRIPGNPDHVHTLVYQRVRCLPDVT